MSFKEVHVKEKLTPEEKRNNRMCSCGKSGEKYTNDHGQEGFVLFACGDVCCPKCLPHRIRSIKDKFAWMNDELKYGFKILSSKDILTSDDVNGSFEMRDHYKKELHSLLWYRVAITGKRLVAIYQKEDKEATEFLKNLPDFNVNQFYDEYVNYTALDENAQETLIIEHKNAKRIVGRGKTPSKAIHRCEVGIKVKDKEIALKRKKSYCTVEEMEKLPKASFRPVKNMVYVMDDESSLTYEQLLKEYVAGNYQEEYEEYLGKWDSQNNKKWFLSFAHKINDEYFLDNKYKFLLPQLQEWYPKQKIT